MSDHFNCINLYSYSVSQYNYYSDDYVHKTVYLCDVSVFIYIRSTIMNVIYMLYILVNLLISYLITYMQPLLLLAPSCCLYDPSQGQN